MEPPFSNMDKRFIYEYLVDETFSETAQNQNSKVKLADLCKIMDDAGVDREIYRLAEVAKVINQGKCFEGKYKKMLEKVYGNTSISTHEYSKLTETCVY